MEQELSDDVLRVDAEGQVYWHGRHLGDTFYVHLNHLDNYWENNPYFDRRNRMQINLEVREKVSTFLQVKTKRRVSTHLGLRRPK